MTNNQLSIINDKYIFLAVGLIVSVLILTPISWAKTYLIARTMPILQLLYLGVEESRSE